MAVLVDPRIDSVPVWVMEMALRLLPDMNASKDEDMDVSSRAKSLLTSKFHLGHMVVEKLLLT